MSRRGLLVLLTWIGVMVLVAFVAPISKQSACIIEQPVVGGVTAVRRLTGNSAQYEVRTAAGCGLLATLPRFPVYGVGDEISLTGKVETIADWQARNQGYAKYLVRRGISGTMHFAAAELLQVEQREETVRSNLIHHTHASFPEPAASALSAMMWGEATRLPPEVEENFQRVGVTHILAISGFNLTLVAGALWGLVLLLPLPRWATVVLVSVLVWGYVALVGAPVSAVRAAWFWTLVLAGVRVKWLISPLTVMLLTVAVMLTTDRNVLFDVGFQLSLAAVAGIWLMWFVSKPLTQRIPKILRAVLVSTVGATLATVPIAAYHFGMISFTTIVANIFIVPATAAFTYLGFATLFVHYISPPLALLLSFGVHLVWQFMDFVTSFLAHVPGLTLTEISVPFMIVPIYYGILLAVSIWWLRRQGRTWREVWA